MNTLRHVFLFPQLINMMDPWVADDTEFFLTFVLAAFSMVFKVKLWFLLLLENQRALDLGKRTRTSTRFYWTFFGRVLKKGTRKASFNFFSPKKLVRLFLLKEVKPSPDRKMINFLHLITCSRHYDILAKSRCRMTMVITFFRQKDAGSRESINYINHLYLNKESHS